LDISGLGPGDALGPGRPHPFWNGRTATHFDPGQDFLCSDTVELARHCGEKKEDLMTIEHRGSTFPRASTRL
jgi:hypothetical protein